MKNKIALLVLLSIFASQSAYAGCSRNGECPIKAKLVRGAKGIASAPVELCNEYHLARAANYNVAESTASGVFVGLLMTGKRLLNGTYDVLTFPLNWPKGQSLLADEYPTAWDEHEALKASGVK